MKENKRYVYSRPYVQKGTRRTKILTTIYNEDELQFDYRFIRCVELCFHWLPSFVCNIGKECHKGKCTVDGRPYDVCAHFMTSMEISC